jgi:hypothetical protein
MDFKTHSTDREGEGKGLKQGGFTMVDQTYAYAREKLEMAVWKLATGEGEVKSRLADAAIELFILQEGDLPADLEAERREIVAQLTSGKMQYETRAKEGQLVQEPVGLLYSTLRFMRRKRAVELAERICTLEAKLEDWIDRECKSSVVD